LDCEDVLAVSAPGLKVVAIADREMVLDNDGVFTVAALRGDSPSAVRFGDSELIGDEKGFFVPGIHGAFLS
jgi:hypothetical protein